MGADSFVVIVIFNLLGIKDIAAIDLCAKLLTKVGRKERPIWLGGDRTGGRERLGMPGEECQREPSTHVASERSVGGGPGTPEIRTHRAREKIQVQRAKELQELPNAPAS